MRRQPWVSGVRHVAMAGILGLGVSPTMAQGQATVATQPATLSAEDIQRITDDFRREHAAEIAAGEQRVHERIVADLVASAKEGKVFAVESLAGMKLPAEEGLPIFQGLLQDSNVEIQRAAMEGIAGYGGRAAGLVPVLLPYLEKNVGDAASANNLRFGAARTLGAIGPEARAAVVPLLALVESADASDVTPYLRAVSIEALGNMGPASARALEAIRPLQASADTAIAYQAFVAVGKIENLPPMEPQRLARDGVAAFNGDAGHRAFAAVRQMPNAEAQQALADLLAANPAASHQLLALELLKGLKPSEAAALREVLGHLGAADPLIAGAAENAVRVARSTDVSAVAMLGEKMKDSNDKVGLHAAVLLAEFGEGGKPAIGSGVEALGRFSGKTVAYRIIATLRFLRERGTDAKEAVPGLLAMLQSDAPVMRGRQTYEVGTLRGSAMAALAAIGAPAEALPLIREALAHGGPAEFAAAARAATHFPGERAMLVPPLIAGLEIARYDREIDATDWVANVYTVMPGHEGTTARVEAIRALVSLGGAEAKGAIPQLRAVAGDARATGGIYTRYRIKEEAEKAIEALSR